MAPEWTPERATRARQAAAAAWLEITETGGSAAECSAAWAHVELALDRERIVNQAEAQA
jgi:hypothetical protein